MRTGLRTPTGVAGLDPLIEGGIPGNSLILLAGNPGTGKTIFSLHFLQHGADKLGEPGLYVSFAEDRDTIASNMSRYGLAIEKLEKEEKIKILDMITMREEGIAQTLEYILELIQSMKARRLVIDSFSAMAQAFRDKIDARIIIHTVLGKIVRKLGCTTLLIDEVPYGSDQIGLSVEEFVSDGVIVFRKVEKEGQRLREIDLLKLRGTEIKQNRYLFTLHERFRVFPPVMQPSMERPMSFKPISDSDDRFSSGCKDLDSLTGGGYPKGSAVLFEISEGAGRPGWPYIGLSYMPILLNSISHRRGVIIIPKEGSDARTIRNVMVKCVDPKLFDEYVRVLERRDTEPSEPYVIRIEGKSARDDLSRLISVAEALRDKSDGKPILMWVGLDRMEHMYDYDELMAMLSDGQINASHHGDLLIRRATLGCKSLTEVSAMSAPHFKIADVNGAQVLFGIKPRFEPQNVEVDVSGNYYQIKLTPLT